MMGGKDRCHQSDSFQPSPCCLAAGPTLECEGDPACATPASGGAGGLCLCRTGDEAAADVSPAGDSIAASTLRGSEVRCSGAEGREAQTLLQMLQPLRPVEIRLSDGSLSARVAAAERAKPGDRGGGGATVPPSDPSHLDCRCAQAMGNGFLAVHEFSTRSRSPAERQLVGWADREGGTRSPPASPPGPVGPPMRQSWNPTAQQAQNTELCDYRQ